jgi:hypothetical protein
LLLRREWGTIWLMDILKKLVVGFILLITVMVLAVCAVVALSHFLAFFFSFPYVIDIAFVVLLLLALLYGSYDIGNMVVDDWRKRKRHK